jgi:hypothetical protein
MLLAHRIKADDDFSKPKAFPKGSFSDPKDNKNVDDIDYDYIAG